MAGEAIELVVRLGIDNLVVVGVGTLLLDIFREDAGVIGKDIVTCKLRLADGDELLAVAHIVDAVDGDAPCLDEGGTEGCLLVNAVPMLHKTLAHDVGLQREMATQTAV